MLLKLKVVFIFLLMLSVTSNVIARQEISSFIAQVTSKGVNVRAGQSSSFEKLYRLKLGDSVLVVGKEFSWYKIKLPLDTGAYISKEFVSISEKGMGEVTGKRVNVRAGSGINFTVLGQMKKGESVFILETLDEWYKIEPWEGAYGWVSEDYIEFKSNDVLAYKKQHKTGKERFIEKKKKVVRLSILKEARKKIEERKQKRIDLLEKQKSESKIVITGVLIPPMNSNGDKEPYKILVGDELTYNLEGSIKVFENFSHYTVKMEGEISNNSQLISIFPVILVKKIELVL